jgi:hypothetical protein
LHELKQLKLSIDRDKPAVPALFAVVDVSAVVPLCLTPPTSSPQRLLLCNETIVLPSIPIIVSVSIR